MAYVAGCRRLRLLAAYSLQLCAFGGELALRARSPAPRGRQPTRARVRASASPARRRSPAPARGRCARACAGAPPLDPDPARPRASCASSLRPRTVRGPSSCCLKRCTSERSRSPVARCSPAMKPSTWWRWRWAPHHSTATSSQRVHQPSASRPISIASSAAPRRAGTRRRASSTPHRPGAFPTCGRPCARRRRAPAQAPPPARAAGRRG